MRRTKFKRNRNEENMKIKNTKNITAILCLTSLLTTACTKEIHTRETVQGQTTDNFENKNEQGQSEKLSEEQREKQYAIWKKLIVSDQKNIALAEVLSVGISIDKKREIQAMVDLLTNEEIQEIINSVKEETNDLKQRYFFGKKTDTYNKLFLNSIISDTFGKKDYQTEVDLLIVSTVNKAQTKALNQILANYDKLISDHSTDVAKKIIVEIAEENKDLADEIITIAKESGNKDDFAKKLEKSQKYIDLIDKHFQLSGSNIKEQLTVIATASVGAFIFLQIKDTPDFQKLRQKFIEIKNKAEEIKTKINDIKAVAHEIKNVWKMNVELNEQMKTGLSDVKKGLEDSFNDAKKSIKEDKIEGKKLLDYVNNVVINGQDAKATKENPTLLAHTKKISDGMKTIASSAEKMSKNFDAVLNGAEKIAAITGVRIPKDLQKAINTAKTVPQGVQVASTIASAFLSGGIMPALGVLSSGPVASMLGLGGSEGPDPEVMAALGRIEGKLDEVLENQKKMLDLQMETLKMIRDLALQIDEYHQTEMKYLDNIRDTLLTNLQISKMQMNEDFRMCEAMIEYKSNSSKMSNKSRNSLFAAARLEFDFDSFYKDIKNLADVRKFVNGIHEESYNNCQKGIAKVFGSTISEENPVMAINNGSDATNYFTFNKEIYQPLNSLLKMYVSPKVFDTAIELALPTQKINSLYTKADKIAKSSYEEQIYDTKMDYLVSTKALERYLTSLLIFYPIIDVNKNTWNGSLENIVNSYYRDVLPTYGTVLENSQYNISRSFYFLNTALTLVKHSIAQEALLAGDNLIPFIYRDLKTTLLSSESCTAITNKLLENEWSKLNQNRTEGDPVCAMRSNPLFIKNFLKYSAYKELNGQKNLDFYQKAYDSKDFQALQFFWSEVGVRADKIKVENGVLKLEVAATDKSVKVTLPTPKELADVNMSYSESMGHLIKLQDKTLSALVKVSPTEFTDVETREKYAKLVLLKFN